MSAAALAVTGSTGAVGGLVARLLAAAEHEQRLLVRSPERAPDLRGASVHRAPYDDRTAVESALEGVDTLLMVSAGEDERRVAQHVAFVDAAADAGVRHIVYTSFAAAASDAVFTLARDHHATEEHIRASGMTWTILRDAFYLDVLPLFADEGGVIRGPAGAGRVAAVARADVAAVAAEVLLRPDAHRDAVYDLTGPESLTLAEAAERIGRATGRAVRFHDETIEEAHASRARWGAPDWQVDAWVSTYTAIASGALAAVTRDVERVTGRPARTLEDVLAGR